MKDLTRREFLGGVAAASAFTIVPRRGLGGRGFIPPSDMLLLAQVGCGTQAQRQVNTGFVARDDLQFCRGRRSKPELAELRRLGAERQPYAHPAVPRRADLV